MSSAEPANQSNIAPLLLSPEHIRQVLALAVQAGEIILRSGGEISRVEETTTILVKAFGIESSQAIVMPTGLYVSVDDNRLSHPITIVRRVRSRALNYNRISDVNNLSRRVVRGLATPEEAQIELDRIERAPNPYPFWLWVCAGAGSAAGATLLLGAGLLDVAPAFVSTILVQLLGWWLDRSKLPAIFGEFFGAAMATAIAVLLSWAGLPIHLDLVIAGGIIKLVPGAALVASVQDGISGDLLSSAARGLETLLKGAAIASGVGLVLTAALNLNISISTARTNGEVWQIPLQVVAAFVAASCYAVASHVPKFAILTAGVGGAAGWLTYLVIVRLNETPLLATFLAAFLVGTLGWGLARWQHSPVTIYILPGILPLLPGLTIYNGMLELSRNENVQGLLLLVQAMFLGGALAAGVALSNSLASAFWHKIH